MNKTYYSLLVATMLVCGQSVADDSIHTGEGTFYGYGGGGNCSFPLPDDSIYTAAMNATDYNNSAACGAVIEVTNTKTNQTVTVRIDDQCPECAKGDVDLDQDAFAEISPLEAGRIPISWKYVANEQAGNMKLFFKEGSSQWWTAVQARDHRYPITAIEYRVSGSGNSYANLERKPYNYFVKADGFGVGPYDFRITDFWGQTVEVLSVPLILTNEIDTATQFPVHQGDGSSGDTGGSGDDGSTPPDDNNTPTSDNIAVSEATDSSWNDGYCETVTVTNNNDHGVVWAVTLDITGSVYNLWDGQWSQSGKTLSVTGASWNDSLSAGASTTFGFCANR
ncbi:expansin EXLX1 family cellulose-binding protein [Vibrio mangrovi]|uniref:Expansin EXLX1 family cellulose-binding protein n=1 Tax=Vibrio mangrovi TaxID=474394 RepID=A0A1Y6ITZ3_9VIBR|nr:expansin EXLX1 family cellulose-binding protein [Vibrio mangrovi]MDW6004816.1 expansin EXLX1 family cellulose-binding protein [Vibrio mangrovi]SMS01108.1 Expansin-YoaJ precursor [Vibrio mangrovi]